jgi:hypothetical protein
MDEEKVTTEMIVEEPVGAPTARQELETLLNELLPEEKRTGDVDQMALDYIKELREQNDRMVEAISDDPKMAQVFADVINGQSGAKSLVRHFGKKFLDVEEGTPEYDEIMAADAEFMAEREKSKAFDEENSTKAQAWFAAFTDYCNRMNLNEDVYLVKIEDEFIKPVMEWEASDETFNKLVKAVDYDKDVDDAFEAGEIKGRNTNIHEMRSKPSDGMPSGLSSQAPVVEKPKVRRNSLIENALKA